MTSVQKIRVLWIGDILFTDEFIDDVFVLYQPYVKTHIVNVKYARWYKWLYFKICKVIGETVEVVLE